MDTLYLEFQLLADVTENSITAKIGDYLPDIMARIGDPVFPPTPLLHVGGHIIFKPCLFTLTCVSQVLAGKNAANIVMQ